MGRHQEVNRYVLLARFLEERRGVPFAWGSHDCCLFACDWVLALKGIDPAEEFRGTYHDEESAREVLEKHGGVRGIAQSVAQKLGFPEVPPIQGCRGDVDLISTPLGESLAIRVGARTASTGVKRMITYPIREVIMTWRVK